MSVLSDSAIKSGIETGFIKIEPFNVAQVNPTSYDLTLGDEVVVYERWVTYDPEWETKVGLGVAFPRDGSDLILRDYVIDLKKEPQVLKWKINPVRGWLLKPGIGYLLCTRERVHTDAFVPLITGKSSLGRLFIQVEATGGRVDPGFSGQYTLQVTVQHPLRVYPGMPIAQVSFETVEGKIEKLYDGYYANSQGAMPSQLWRQVERLD